MWIVSPVKESLAEVKSLAEAKSLAEVVRFLEAVNKNIANDIIFAITSCAVVCPPNKG
jgi:hypothetical protein